MRAAYLRVRPRATEARTHGAYERRHLSSCLRVSVAVLAFTLYVGAGFAQTPADLNARLPLDKAIRTGTLPNGMTFYIRKNSEPDDRAMMRLAIRAGSVDEA